jgi:hypothetical protein
VDSECVGNVGVDAESGVLWVRVLTLDCDGVEVSAKVVVWIVV